MIHLLALKIIQADNSNSFFPLTSNIFCLLQKAARTVTVTVRTGRARGTVPIVPTESTWS